MVSLLTSGGSCVVGQPASCPASSPRPLPLKHLCEAEGSLGTSLSWARLHAPANGTQKPCHSLTAARCAFETPSLEDTGNTQQEVPSATSCFLVSAGGDGPRHGRRPEAHADLLSFWLQRPRGPLVLPPQRTRAERDQEGPGAVTQHPQPAEDGVLPVHLLSLGDTQVAGGRGGSFLYPSNSHLQRSS